MKLQTNQTITVAQERETRLTVLRPATYFAVVKEIDDSTYQGRVYDREAKEYFTDDKGSALKLDYYKLIPDVHILTEGKPVSSKYEDYVVGTIRDGLLVDMRAEKYGTEPRPVWFGHSGGGSLMVAVGMIDPENQELTGLEAKDVRDVVVKVSTSVGAYLPADKSKNYDDYQSLKELLKPLNDGVEPEFEDIEFLVLKYNITNGYTSVSCPASVFGSETNELITLDAESDLSVVTRQSYSALMQTYYNADTVSFNDLKTNSKGKPVRLKTKNLVNGFYRLSELDVDSSDENWYRADSGVTYRSKSAVPRSNAPKVATGW